MATHSSVLARKIPQTEEHDGLQSEGLQRDGHDSDTLNLYKYIPLLLKASCFKKNFF